MRLQDISVISASDKNKKKTEVEEEEMDHRSAASELTSFVEIKIDKYFTDKTDHLALIDRAPIIAAD